jgi:hypothetical protein
MNQNLDALRSEILEYLEAKKLAAYHGILTDMPNESPVLWDIDKSPDFRTFVDCGVQAGVKLMIFNWRNLQGTMIEDALEQLEEADFSREEQRSIQRRLKELKAYEGFTCSLELMFDFEARLYLYARFADWYEDLLDILQQVEDATAPEFDDDEPDDEEPGYFSRN